LHMPTAAGSNTASSSSSAASLRKPGMCPQRSRYSVIAAGWNGFTPECAQGPTWRSSSSQPYSQPHHHSPEGHPRGCRDHPCAQPVGATHHQDTHVPHIDHGRACRCCRSKASRR
jgi:hypothetical protein